MTQLELIEGTTRDAALSQFFTPPKLARKLVEWAGVTPCEPCGYGMPNAGTHNCGQRVLEPSAGNGAIVRELVAAGAEVYGVEIDPRYFGDLALIGANDREDRFEFGIGDFFAMEPGADKVDLVCGNFPFHLDLTGAFTLHALEFAPRVCAIYPANVFYSEQRAEFWKLVRPTRIAYMSKRAWPGATDYVALDLQRRMHPRDDTPVRVEWWLEDWG